MASRTNIITISKGENFDEIGALIKQSSVLTKAVKSNPSLLLAISEAAEYVAGLDKFNDFVYEGIIKSNIQLKFATQDKAFNTEFRKFLDKIFADKKVKPRFPGNTPTQPLPTGDEEEEEETSFETADDGPNLELLSLIFDIPIAHIGDIITSEHHNSLRRAIRAIAAEIGTSVDKKILNFAPNLLPFSAVKENENEKDWKVFYNKAVVPGINESGGAGGTAKGGFAVQFPDNALISEMVVRGRRLDEEFDNPKAFDVTLVRVKLDTPNAKPSPLIEIDLREETAFFKKKGAPKLVDLRAENSLYQYFVLANWEDEDDSARFEINSIQILCNS